MFHTLVPYSVSHASLVQLQQKFHETKLHVNMHQNSANWQFCKPHTT